MRFLTLGEFGVLVDNGAVRSRRSDTRPSARPRLGAVICPTRPAGARRGDTARRRRASGPGSRCAGGHRRRCAGVARRRRVDRRNPDPSEGSAGSSRLCAPWRGRRPAVARAEVHLTLAGLLHEQAVDVPGLLLNRAVPHYHSVILPVGASRGAPQLWAAARTPIWPPPASHADESRPPANCASGWLRSHCARH